MPKQRVRKNSKNLRILAGSWRGRKIIVPEHEACRATLTRARQMLFDFLAHQDSDPTSLEGYDVVDLYAGSASLALEALSRGARSAVCVERNRNASKVIQENFTSFDASDRLRMCCNDVLTWLAAPVDCAYNLIFADPPYGANRKMDMAWPELLTPESIKHRLLPGGMYILQHHRRCEAPPAGPSTELQRTLVQGKTQFSIFTHASVPDDPVSVTPTTDEKTEG